MGSKSCQKRLDERKEWWYFTIRLINQMVYKEVHSDRLNATFAALADPTRRAILARLVEGPANVKELATPFRMSLPAISKHLKVLEHAGLISRGREAQWRPCKLEASPLKDVADWTEQYRRFFEASLDRLGVYLKDLQAKRNETPKQEKDDGHAPR
jgi:DNA-binding transcriptional ArsR family regulator